MSEPVTPFRLTLFGGFRLTSLTGTDADASEEGAVPLQIGKKAQGLITFLARTDRHSANREKLAALLWDDRGEQQARQSLRQAISSVRKALSEASSEDGAEILKSEGESVEIDLEKIEVDVERFVALADDTDNLAEALALYAGGLLEDGGSVSDSFDSWLLTERRHLNDLAAVTMDRLAERDDAWAASAAAKTVADRLISTEPFSEPATRVLLRHALLNGQTATASRLYREFKELLAEELQSEPEKETQALLDTVKPLDAQSSQETTKQDSGEETSGVVGPLPSRLPEVGDSPARTADLTASSTVYPAPSMQGDSDAPGGSSVPARLLLIAAVLITIAGVGVLFSSRMQSDTTVPSPVAALRENSISIRPFRPIGSDDRTAVISTGLYEGLTSAMTMIGDVSVVMDASAVSGFENKTTHYLLDGSVQAVGDRLRITANLTSTQSSERVWSQLYERSIDDIVSVQNNITLSLLKALQVELSDGEQARVRPINETDNIEAWLLAANALRHVRQLSPEQMDRARALYNEALALDPDYSSAKTGLAWTHTVDLLFGWSAAPDEARKVVKETGAFLRKSDPNFPFGYTLQALSDLMEGKHRAAKRNGLRGVKLMPASAEANALYAYILTFTGEYEEAVTLTQRAIELSPAKRNWIHWNLARAKRLGGDPAAALSILQEARPTQASSPVYNVERAAALAALGRSEDARSLAQDILAIIPDFSVASWVQHPPYDESSAANRERELLMSIGLPE